MKVVKNVLTYGVLRPLFYRKIKALARSVDVICDFDMTLRTIAGKYGVLWLGVNHYSIAARFSGLRRKRIEQRGAQLVRYDAIAVQTSEMLRDIHLAPNFHTLKFQVSRGDFFAIWR